MTLRSQSQRRPSTTHPYAAIEHRVIDSPAYAALSFSARALLVLMARQLSKDNNNGHLHAAFAWCKKYGFGSEHTLRNAIAELIAHGFIYRTRSHGANGAWACYAVTWLSIKQRDGLFLDGFKSCAWRDSISLENKPEDKKTTRQKMPDQSGRKCSFTPENPAESAGSRGAKSADNELVPSRGVYSALSRGNPDQESRSQPFAANLGDWIPAYVNRLTALGLAHACPVAIQ